MESQLFNPTKIAGKSGLVLKNRGGLRKLIQDVLSGSATFRLILVYDVSRWGRFQDTDEAAHYEFICRCAGIPVHYCAECFQNNHEMPNLILKWLKRMMAGEYSRELSVKVFAGLAKIARLGFRTGGVSGYGFRRMLVSPDRSPKLELKHGQRKSIHEDRVILVPGPEQEVDCVREIYRLFIQERKSSTQIARELNQRGIPYRGTKRVRWYSGAVYRILRAPKYAGWHVFGRYTERLQTPRVKAAENLCVKTPNAWTPIVSQKIYDKAQKEFFSFTRHKSDQQLLDELRKLVARKGLHCTKYLGRSKVCSSSGAYTGRFGTLTEALTLIGVAAPRQRHMIARRGTRMLRDQLIKNILSCCEGVSIVQEPNKHFRSKLRLADGTLVSVYVCRSSVVTDRVYTRWILQPRGADLEYPCLLARLTETNDAFQDYFVVHDLKGFGAKNLRLEDAWLRQALPLKLLADLPQLVQQIQQRAEEGCDSELKGCVAIAKFLRVSVSTVRRWVSDMPVRREGMYTVANRSDLREWIDRQSGVRKPSQVLIGDADISTALMTQSSPRSIRGKK